MPEVGEDHACAGTRRRHEHVLVLQVAVHDAVDVQEVDGLEDLVCDYSGGGLGELVVWVECEIREEVAAGYEGLEDVAACVL